MRVALDATYSVDHQPTGIAIYSREILDGLARAHLADTFLHCYRPKQWLGAPRPRAPNVRVRILQPPLPTFRADLFHALNQRVDRRPAPRVVSTFHDLFVITSEYSSPEFRRRFAAQARSAADHSDLIIAVSEFTAAQVVDLLHVDRSRIRVIPHGVHHVAPQEPVAREQIVLFAGVLQARKNVIRLIDAFERACANSNWTLLLAGGPSGYGAAEILNRIENSRCRDRIRVAGYVAHSELQRLYARASIFAFPSLDEGFGIPVLEAMAHCVPVLTSTRPSLVEIAEGCALLVDPYDTDAIAAALSRLIEDADLREKLGNLGRTRAQSFSWDRTVSETYAVYRELTLRS